MRQIKFLATFALLLVLLTAATKDKTTTIFMIGDSTMANKDITEGKQERGWGMALQCYFDDNIVIDNHAVNGRSSLSFINEGRWDAVLQKMCPGDYVIIQFGHNDEKSLLTATRIQALPLTIIWQSSCVRLVSGAVFPC